ncbi:MAG: uroporphyrinogen decarboxylase family protein [Planctomycetota bacterium]
MGQSWTSRRRMLAALACEVPDRVPVCTYELVGYNSHAWENREPSYAQLMERIRAATDCAAMWGPGSNQRFLGSAFQSPLETKEERRGRFAHTTTILHTPKGALRHVSEHDPDVHTSWEVEHWCKNTADVDKALSVPYVPPTYEAGDYPRISNEVGEHGILMPSLSDPAYMAAALMKFEDYVLWVFEETEHFARTVEVLAERVMENLRRELSVCVADLYRICGPEYMTPPFTPPRMFERFMVPHVSAMTQLIHQRGSKVRLHCHGKIGRVLDMILATGCDGTDPCEPPPDGDIELDEIKRRCAARKVSVFGNIELKVLENCTPQEVRETVRRAMAQAKAGGGFVLMPTAAPINVPLSPATEANYMAFIDAGLEFGKY